MEKDHFIRNTSNYERRNTRTTYFTLNTLHVHIFSNTNTQHKVHVEGEGTLMVKENKFR